MFTGIIETIGEVINIKEQGTNITFFISSSLSAEFKVDQSISHNGVCLTVEGIADHTHRVTAIKETIDKTNLGQWKIGTKVNIERCMQMNGRLDGHIVQGHVDAVAKCIAVADKEGSWEYTFEFDQKFASLIIEKGSISVNGTSLTIFNINDTKFTVAIIPYTYTHTNMHQLQVNDFVNIEFDMIGKYVNRIHSLR